MVFIKEGEVITCENGHSLYKATQDIEIDSAYVEPGQLVALHHESSNFLRMENYPPCPFCSAPWVKWACNKTRLHLVDGWR